MTGPSPLDVSRRERQIMDVLFRRGRATVAEVRAEMPDPPSYSAVRTMLGLLEAKRHVRHEEDGRRYVYLPVLGRDRARRTAVRNLLRTFFDDSVPNAVASLLGGDGSRLSDEDLDRIEALVERARKGVRR